MLQGLDKLYESITSEVQKHFEGKARGIKERVDSELELENSNLKNDDSLRYAVEDIGMDRNGNLNITLKDFKEKDQDISKKLQNGAIVTTEEGYSQIPKIGS